MVLGYSVKFLFGFAYYDLQYFNKLAYSQKLLCNFCSDSIHPSTPRSSCWSVSVQPKFCVFFILWCSLLRQFYLWTGHVFNMYLIIWSSPRFGGGTNPFCLCYILCVCVCSCNSTHQQSKAISSVSFSGHICNAKFTNPNQKESCMNNILLPLCWIHWLKQSEFDMKLLLLKI